MSVLEKEAKQREEARQSLQRMKEFDVETLARKAQLGEMSFEEVVEPAQRLVDLYQRLSVEALDDMSGHYLNEVLQAANRDYALFEKILQFKVAQANPADVRKAIINEVVNAYAPTFQNLHGLIAFSLHRSADFEKLDRDARATSQGIKDRADVVIKELKSQQEQAAQVVKDVRKMAAESGVTQQAIYFQEEAEVQEKASEDWRRRTIGLAVGLGIYAAATAFLHKLDWLAPANAYDTVQLAVSKILVFTVISYMLYLSARNFMSHKHNAVVNKHRQNALMTFKALADAAEHQANRDVVLTHAAVCIFSPQGTGYWSDGSTSAPSSKTFVEMLTGASTRSEPT